MDKESDGTHRVRASDALSALTRIEGAVQSRTPSLVANDVQTIATFIAETTGRVAPEDNTGLPCSYCDQKLPKFHAEKTGDGRTIVRVSGVFDSYELKGLLAIIRTFSPKGKE